MTDLFGPENITSQLDLTGDGHGHHIPGTPFVYKHGWKPVSEQAGVAQLHKPDPADTLEKHTRPDGTLAPERQALHRQIIDGILAGHQPHEHKVATFFGGGPASGKSTLGSVEDSVHIDPDEIKGKLPEYQQMVKDGDPKAAAYAHEESSLIGKLAMQEAQRQGLNFTLDGTGDSKYDKLSAKVAQARSAGYQVHARYVTADTEEAVRRAEKRAQLTGRMVPPSVIREIHAAVSQTFSRAVAENMFDHAELWDNNGLSARKIATQAPGQPLAVSDPAAWQRFLSKGGA